MAVTLQDLLQAGVHFGHSVRYWNPKTKDYVFTVRNRVHIIDLRKTLQSLQEVRNAVSRISANGQKILFAGTKRSIAKVIEEEARRADMPYVSRRWLGGMLTNYRTIKQSIARLQELETMQQDSTMDKLGKKEVIRLMREYENLQRNIGGIKDMGGLPQALFVVDVYHERIAVEEAHKMKIPVFAIVDTNSNPDGVDYVIPGNDDSRRSVALLTQVIADACIEGRQQSGALGGDAVAPASVVSAASRSEPGRAEQAGAADASDAGQDDAAGDSRKESAEASEAEQPEAADDAQDTAEASDAGQDDAAGDSQKEGAEASEAADDAQGATEAPEAERDGTAEAKAEQAKQAEPADDAQQDAAKTGDAGQEEPAEAERAETEAEQGEAAAAEAPEAEQEAEPEKAK